MWRSALSRPSRWLVCAVFLSSAICTDALAQDGTGALEAGGAELALVPVGSSAPHVINGNEITIPSVGATVELEILGSGFQQNELVCMIEYRTRIDSSGYSSGLSGTLSPAQISCATDDDCFGSSGCGEGLCDVGSVAFIDQERVDFLFSGFSVFIGMDTSTLDFAYAASVFAGCSARDTWYGGTLVLDAPENASGTFTVGFRPHPDTAVVDDDNQFVPLLLTPALITVIVTECGNGVTELGEECDGIDDGMCPGACLMDCTCASCSNGTCDAIEDSCTCPTDCGPPPPAEIPLETCNDGFDNDCDGSIDSADSDCPSIPAVSEWGLFSMAILLLIVAKVYWRRRDRHRLRFDSLILLTSLYVTVSSETAVAQRATISTETIQMAIDSGEVFASGTPTTAVPVFSRVIASAGARWLRLHFEQVELAGSRAAGNESFLRITSLEDGAVQTLSSATLTRWRNSSAYFNGDSVLLEILAYPNAGVNRVVVNEALLGKADEAVAAAPDSDCSDQTDDRVQSFDPRTGRLVYFDFQPIESICTGFLFNNRPNCLLTAGHCCRAMDFNSEFAPMIEFNVPLSYPDGTIKHPDPEDQYCLDEASVQWQDPVVFPENLGDDWCYLGAFDYCDSSMSPVCHSPLERQGDSFRVPMEPYFVPGPGVFATLRVAGYGIQGPNEPLTTKHIQQVDTGPYLARCGTTMEYNVDAEIGNSGSAVEHVCNGLVYGILQGGCGAAPLSEVQYATTVDHPNLWKALANPLGICADCNKNGIPDGQESECSGNGIPDDCEPAGDCQPNGFPDVCDIAGTTSSDVNQNLIPDECELPPNCPAMTTDPCKDCNANESVDACDVMGATSTDCNTNQIPDECDINFGGSADCNGNMVPDECEGLVADPPVPEKLALPGGPVSVKNRFLSITAGKPGRLQAIRVTAPSLPPPFDIWPCQSFYAREPQQVCENAGQGLETGPPNCGPAPGLGQEWFWAAPLTCFEGSAAFKDWTTLRDYCTKSGDSCVSDADCPQGGGTCGIDGVIHLYHEAVIPSKLESPVGPIKHPAVYDIQMMDSQCEDIEDEANYSAPLRMIQAGWGDVTRNPPGNCPPGAPSNTVDLIPDCTAILAKFSNDPCAITKARADLLRLMGDEIDFKIDIADVTSCVTAYSDGNYPFVPNQCAFTGASGEVPTSVGPISAGFMLTAAQAETKAGDKVQVHVFASDLTDLRAYQVKLTVDGGSQGQLTLTDLRIETERADYVFNGLTDLHATDLSGSRLGGTLVGGAIDSVAQAYLGTFTYQPSADAAGVFNVSVDTASGASFLIDENGDTIPFDEGTGLAVTVVSEE